MALPLWWFGPLLPVLMSNNTAVGMGPLIKLKMVN